MDVSIPCPHCHQAFAVPLAEIAPGASRPCPACGAQIKFSGSDASKVQGVIDQLSRVPGVKVNVTVRQKSKPWWKFWA